MTDAKHEATYNQAKTMTLDELMHGALYESDCKKKAIYKLLLDQAMAQKQLAVINRQDFTR